MECNEVKKKQQTVYGREEAGYQFPPSKKILMVHLILLVTILLATYSYLRTVLLLVYAVIVFLEVLIFMGVFTVRLKIESDGIIFYTFFKRSKVLYKEIDSIVISHAWHDRHPGAGWLGKFKRCSGGKIRFQPYP